MKLILRTFLSFHLYKSSLLLHGAFWKINNSLFMSYQRLLIHLLINDSDKISV